MSGTASSFRRRNSFSSVTSERKQNKNKDGGRNSARSSISQASDVSGLLSVSPVKGVKKKGSSTATRTSPPKNFTKPVIVTVKDRKQRKPQVVESLNFTEKEGQTNRTGRPAWAQKQPEEDTARSDYSSTTTTTHHSRPSLADFVDLTNRSSYEGGEENNKLMHQLADIDTDRSELIDKTSSHTADPDETPQSPRHCIAARDEKPKKIALDESVDFMILKDFSDDEEAQIPSWGKKVSESSPKKSVSKKPEKQTIVAGLKKTLGNARPASKSKIKNADAPSTKSKNKQTKTHGFLKNKSPEPVKKYNSVYIISDDKISTASPNITRSTERRDQQSVNDSGLQNCRQVCPLPRTKQRAAKTIQTWWRTNSTTAAGKKSGETNDLKIMMEQKKGEIEERMSLERKIEKNKQAIDYEQIRRREEKARIARQKVIDEMHAKRNKNKQSSKSSNAHNPEKVSQSVTMGFSDDKSSRLDNKSSRLSTRPSTASSNRRRSSKKDEENSKQVLEEKERPDTTSTVTRLTNEIFEAEQTKKLSPRQPDMEEDSIALNDVIDDVTNDVTNDDATSVTTTSKTYADLLDTLKQLEEEPIITKSPIPQKSSELKDSWDLKNEERTENALLSADKLQSIMSFLDTVEKSVDTDRQERAKGSFYSMPDLSDPGEDHHDNNHVLTNNKNSDQHANNNDDVAKNDQADRFASDISEAITAQKLEIDEKERTVEMMKKALAQQKEFTSMQLKEMQKEHKQQLDLTRTESEATIQRHLSFIDQLIEDKKVLTERCEEVVTRIKDVDQKYSNKIKQLTENHAVELKKQKDVTEAAEKLRREKWIREKTQEIKEVTVKGLEPEIQRLIAKHKAEVKKIKAMKQGEVLEADERVGRKYVQQLDELRTQLEKEKEMAVKKEREAARVKIEEHLREEEESFQQQRRRLYAEVDEEKKRVSEQLQEAKRDFDARRLAYETTSRQTLQQLQEERTKLAKATQQTHQGELAQCQEQAEIEKQQWVENYMKKQQTTLLAKERELKESVREARDREIEMVIEKLERESALNREEAEKTAENRIKRIRDKYAGEVREYEALERALQEKCSQLKERMEGLENDLITSRSSLKQKTRELEDAGNLSQRLQDERGKVHDIIRTEYADRLVALEEESKRLRSELTEEKSRHKFNVDRLAKDKDHELEEVHKRVKKAIAKKDETTNVLRQQKAAAEKRAEHLEQLLAEQRKKILTK